MNLISESIERYARAHSREMSDAMNAIEKVTHEKTEWPQMLVGPLQGAFLRLMVRLTSARNILEIGTFTGYSALAMAEALPDSGRVITCDINPETSAMAQEHWARSPHGHKIELKLGAALETLRELKGPFDLAFIDADKQNYRSYWDAVLELVRPGGAILVDNVLWSGRVLDPKEETDHFIHEFNEWVVRDERTEAVMLQFRDGVTVAWKKEN